jgi:hypothetical protein
MDALKLAHDPEKACPGSIGGGLFADDDDIVRETEVD